MRGVGPLPPFALVPRTERTDAAASAAPAAAFSAAKAALTADCAADAAAAVAAAQAALCAESAPSSKGGAEPLAACAGVEPACRCSSSWRSAAFALASASCIAWSALAITDSASRFAANAALA